MQTILYQTIEECFKASNEGTAHFGEIVKKLLEIGIESYHADYRLKQTIYYLPNGDTYSIALPTNDNKEIAEHFDAEAIKDAIRGSQRGEIKYPEFKQLSKKAGCVGYIVWLLGRQVTYFGRRGEIYLEHFPS